MDQTARGTTGPPPGRVHRRVDCGSTVSAVADIAGRGLRGGLAGGGGAAVQQAGAGEREGASADRQRAPAPMWALAGQHRCQGWVWHRVVARHRHGVRRSQQSAQAGHGGDRSIEPVPFDGWLDLLRVLCELVAAAGGENRQVTDSSAQATETSNWHEEGWRA